MLECVCAAGMLREACRRLVSASPVLMLRRHYKHHVINEAFAQLDSICDQQCFPPPRQPQQKVTVIGADSDVGRIVSLLLKQQSVVKILAMYDENVERRVVGVANDIAHIDTTCAVHAYQGRRYLKDALHNADVVLICGGYYVTPPCCNILDRDLFFYNMQMVRTATMAIAQFAPHAVVAVQVPPVDCNFTLCKHTLELFHTYDKRRLLGVNSVNTMRANQYISQVLNTDPEDSYVPVICGTGRCTRVPVLSTTKNYYCISAKDKDFLLRLVREADEMICRVKSNHEQGHLSIGFATARCIVNIMKGMFEKPAFIDSALVEQHDPKICYNMPICATPVTVGRNGIETYHVLKLNDAENTLLEESKCDLEDMLNLGRCYAVGEDYVIHPEKVAPCFVTPPPCEVCKDCK